MSNVIKSHRVLYSEVPRIIQLAVVNSSALPIEETELETESDVALHSAFEESAEIRSRAQIEAHFVYRDSFAEGTRSGREEGLQKGLTEGGARAAEQIRELARQFTAQLCQLDSRVLAQHEAERADSIEFAFGLAENILSVQIDRAEYASMLADFLPVVSCSGALEADGCQYPITTCRGEVLQQVFEELQAAEDTHGVSLTVEQPILDAAPDAEPYSEEDSFLLAAADGVSMESAPLFDEEADCFEEEQAWTQSESVAQASFAAADEPMTLPDEAQNPQQKETAREESTQAESENRASEIEVPDTTDSDSVSQDDEAVGEIPTEESAELIGSEKFVFVRPARKTVYLPADSDGSERQKFGPEEMAAIGQDQLKAIFRKAEVSDIAAALTGADETVRNTFLDAMPRRVKQNVLDAINYLGPVAESDVDAARDRLATIFHDLQKARKEDPIDD